MARFKCKRIRTTIGSVCKDWVKRGKKRVCVRRVRKRVKRCADFGVTGKVRGGVYGRGKIRKRARVVR